MGGWLDPEVAAAELLYQAEIDAPPVDLSRVVALWPGLRITEVKLDGAGYLLPISDRCGEILVRKADHPARRAYTCAHELGHWVLNTREPTSGGREHRSIVERWCDRFAAALLMPDAWVRASLQQLGFSMSAVADLHKAFGVSRRAMWLRTSEVAPIDLAVIQVSRTETRVLWASTRDKVSRLDMIGTDTIAAMIRESPRARMDWETQDLRISGASIGMNRWLVGVSFHAAIRVWESSVIRMPLNYSAPTSELDQTGAALVAQMAALKV